MDARTKGIMGVLAFFVILAIVIYAFSGIIGVDPHLRADKAFLQGVNCEFRQDYNCARDQFEKAIAIYERDSRYYVHLANLQGLQGNYSDAISTYMLAKEVDPSDENVLPGLDKVVSQQATQTALPPSSSQPVISTDTAYRPILKQPESIFPIFDEDFGIIGSVSAEPGTVGGNIRYEIVDDEAYSGRYSLLISWNKFSGDWASVILHFDTHNDLARALAGQMTSIDLSPPSNFAIQFFAKRGEASTRDPQESGTLMDKSITLKFQDQTLLFKESVGNQAVYSYAYDTDHSIPDGRLKLSDEDWQEFCLPLENFKTDLWVDKGYTDFPQADRKFDWSNVKQINIDADFYSTEGSVYIDAMRIIRASDCVPYP
jgi:hypothetical protein